MNPHLGLLLSAIYDNSDLDPLHLTDLRRSSLTDDTIRLQRIRSVPPGMIAQLLGFDMSAVRSAYLIPFPDPRGGWMDHPRLKVFPSFADQRGNTVKYLQPKRSGCRLFFPLATLGRAVRGSDPLWLVEGEKKALAVSQLSLPAVGFCGIEGWHVRGTTDLLPDFDFLSLERRLVELVPDGDVQTNDDVRRGAERYAEALERRGATVRLVKLPVEISYQWR